LDVRHRRDQVRLQAHDLIAVGRIHARPFNATKYDRRLGPKL
jgi:hypothetical protein